MAHEFRLPDIGEGLTEAEIVQWLVAEGERVEADQPVVEVETDKAVVEIPSPFAGVVIRHGGAEGETIHVGEVLVVIGEESELDIAQPIVIPPRPVQAAGIPAEGEAPGAHEPEAGLGTAAVWDEPEPIVGTLGEEVEVLTSPVAGERPTQSGVRALPLVRKLAREAGIDIETLAGTGIDGRITREDVESAIAAREASQVPPSTEPTVEVEPLRPPEPAEAVTPAVEPSEPAADERRPMSRLRRTIAANMARSWAEVPHVTTFDDANATRLLEVQRALGERHQTKIPVEALVIRAVLPALRAHPEFNASVDGDDLILHGSHDIGIAVDTDEGLVVAVIRDADSKNVLALASEVRRLGEAARGRSLGPDELRGQTFTVSNIGALGGGHGTPIVPPGTTAILSIGRARPRPAIVEGALAVAPVMPLSLSYDHRVIDGGMGRRFIALVMENLEEPALFLAE